MYVKGLGLSIACWEFGRQMPLGSHLGAQLAYMNKGYDPLGVADGYPS